jgi:hypothetical protein
VPGVEGKNAMNSILKLSIPIILALIVTGCSFTPTTTLLSSTQSPALLSTRTSTSLPPAITSTPTKLPVVTRQCLAVTTDNLQFSGKDYGAIIFARDDSSSELLNKLAQPYLYEPGSNQKMAIHGINFAISLDRNMYAYRLADQNKIFVSNKNNQILATIDSQDFITRWTKNGVLVETFMEGGSKITFLNPFTGEKKTLQEDFPNRYIIDYAHWGIGRNVYYDPQLNMALYLAKNENNSKYISLWNVSANKEIGRISEIIQDDSQDAEWSTDSKQVIIRFWKENNQVYLFSIHQDGHLESLFLDGELSKQDAIQYSLSSNSKKLALWLFNETSQKWEIAVLDMQTKRVVNCCIESKYFPNVPIWSPNSSSLLFQIDEDTANTSTVLIDLDKNIAVQIAENAKAVGWLK